MKSLNSYLKTNLRTALRMGAVAVLLFASIASAVAGPITREQAQDRAQAFLKNKRGAQRLTPVTRGARLAPRHRQPATGTDLYYVFDRGTDEGFVIVSGDDQTPAVLGYTDAGSFDYSAIPDNMREWLDNYAQQIADVQQAGYTASELPVAALKTHDPIDVLVETRWNQGSPYNLLCPDYFRTGRSVTGCVATAMAQVLYYHRANAPRELLDDIPDYTVADSHETYGDFHVKGYPAGSPIDWDNMQPTYNANSTPQQRRAVAELMSYCGTAVRMMYTSSSSGAYSSDVPDALKKYFGYPSTCRAVNRSDVSEEKFDETVYAELAKGDPVYLSGSNGSGGHAFVCDGYDGNLCYHINWGWGGGSDGYFLLANLKPGSPGIGGSPGGYSDGQTAIVGMHLDDWRSKTLTFSDSRVRAVAVEKWDTDGDNKVSYGEAAAVTGLGDAFKGLTLRTFNELYWFTGLKEVPADAFAGCTSMTAVRLPKGLKRIGDRAFDGCTALKTVEMPAGLQQVGEAAFRGCAKLVNFALPTSVDVLGASALEGCKALTALTLPAALTRIGDRALAGCTKLASVTFESLQPQGVETGKDLFDGVDLAAARLAVAEGNDDFFRTTAPWNAFGNMTTERNLASGKVVAPAEEQVVYLYNVGTQRYLAAGEASDVQGTVSAVPMRFRLGHTEVMPDGTYYLIAEEISGSSHYFYRLNTSSEVGSGVKATFLNGNGTRISARDMSAWWNVQEVSKGVYTLQTPAEAKGYAEGEFLGTDRNHATNFASPTSGVYSDINYEDNPQNCQWMFIAYDETAAARHAAALVLGNLLAMAPAELNVSAEQAVYDNMDASVEELQVAQQRVRKKLGLITFASDEVRQVCLDYWDLDYDGELTAYEIGGVPGVSTRFQNCKMTSFDEFQHFKGVKSLPSRSFSECRKLESIVLPEAVTSVGSKAFQNCTSLQLVELPAYVAEIGTAAFSGCSALQTMRLHVVSPEYIEVDASAFEDVDLSQATLYVPHGSRELFAEAEVWKDFGSIREMRSTTRPKFSQFNVNEDGYVYNIGTRKYISRGEAYGTQAVVAPTGMVYQFRRTTLSGKPCYYLYSEETGRDNKNLFRSEDDSKVGKGIRTCFVDGGSDRLTDRSAYWTVEYVEGDDPCFTMQVPASLKAAYVEGEYLGIDVNHETNAVSGSTLGLYWDVVREENEANCLWAWVSMADVEAARQFDRQVAQLKRYLQLAGERGVEAAEEQAVYDNLDARPAEIRGALDTLCAKLHLIRFDSDAAKRICINNWDENIDGELSYEEAAAVKDLGEVFRAQKDIVTLDELQYFTGLTEIPEDAFRSCTKLFSIYIPAGVQKVGMRAFSSSRNLKYVVFMNPSTTVVESSGCDIYPQATIFVAKAALEAYRVHENWSYNTIEEYTGVPIVMADTLSRAYGAGNSTLTFSVKGAPINGTPELATEINLKTEVGEYPITIEAGNVTTPGVQFKDGIYKVVPAMLTVTAKSYSRHQGEENPEFEYTIKGFKNKETEEVLTKKPVAVCEATKDSPAGRYEITFSGAEAANYDFEYVSGRLEVTAPDGVGTIQEGQESRQQYYDLSGRPVVPRQRGVYVTRGKRVSVR